MVRLRPPVRRAESTETDRAEGTRRDGGRSSRIGLARDALVGAAVGAAAYLAVRRARSTEGFPAVDRVRDALGEGRSGSPPAGTAGRDDEGEDAVGGDDPSGRPSLDASTTDRTDEEIRGRASEDARSDPAEPGEMTVDEDVADALVDGDDANGE